MTSSSSASVLYDAAGPRGRARNRVYSVLGTVLVVGFVAYVVIRLAAQGQFNPGLWEIFEYAGVQNTIRDGLLTTLETFAIAGALSLVLGLLLAVARLSDHAALRWFGTGFVELFRAIPLLVTVYVLWVLILSFSEPLGLTGEQPQFWALVVGLTVYNGSVQAEVLRAGVNSVPKGQREAAFALGMSKTQVMTTVLMPQAVRAMLPTIISQLVVTLKDTSLGYIVGFEELLYGARQMSTNITVDGHDTYIPVVIVTGAIYITMCLLLSALATWIEKRGRRARTGIKVAGAVEPAEAPDALATTAAPVLVGPAGPDAGPPAGGSVAAGAAPAGGGADSVPAARSAEDLPGPADGGLAKDGGAGPGGPAAPGTSES
ncbi:amino acid ABC transporter permease [Streptomyces sp. NPDC059740]|uniref:amino acid ABC transporter permease n=1 Tax=Streptomyces sp. NPDC059740 TaxID=3346926 RepID=UPI003646B500